MKSSAVMPVVARSIRLRIFTSTSTAISLREVVPAFPLQQSTICIRLLTKLPHRSLWHYAMAARSRLGSDTRRSLNLTPLDILANAISVSNSDGISSNRASSPNCARRRCTEIERSASALSEKNQPKSPSCARRRRGKIVGCWFSITRVGRRKNIFNLIFKQNNFINNRATKKEQSYLPYFLAKMFEPSYIRKRFRACA